MDVKNMLQSKMFYKVLCGVGVALVLVLVFHAGVLLGYHKANFSYRWGENYHRNFGGPKGGFVGMGMRMMGGDYLNPRGTFGKVIKVELPVVVVQGRDDAEKSIVISSDTVIRRFQDTLKDTDIKVGDSLVVIGEPNNNGQINAKLIRMIPSQQ